MERALASRFFQSAGEMWRLFFDKRLEGGLPSGAVPLMHMIHMLNGASTTELASKIGVTKSAISQTLNLLEEKGYIERTVDKVDRRQTRVELTKRGLEVEKQRRDEMFLRAQSIFARMGQEEAEQLVAQIEKCVKAVREEMES